MKRKHFLNSAKRHSLLAGFAALLMAAIFTIAGCDNPAGGDTTKVVEAKYRFTYDLRTAPEADPWGTFTLGENSIVFEKITGDDEFPDSFTLTGVYTAGGGTYTWDNGSETGGGDWAYLYDGSGKRGLVMIETEEGDYFGLIAAALGSTAADADNYSDYIFDPAIAYGEIITDGPSGDYSND
jgi:hypothetical protein